MDGAAFPLTSRTCVALTSAAGTREDRLVLILSRSDVEGLLDLRELIDAVGSAMADLSAGRASVPNRVAAMVSERQGLLGAMPGYVPSLGALTAKLVTLFPQNSGGPLPTHQALIGAFDPETGEPVAVMDGTAITALRTGAGAALSTRLLAREDAHVLAIIGTGVQARSHARTVSLVRDFSEVRVAGRSQEKAEQLARELLAAGLPAQAASSCEQAIRGADVVCATTHALEPVVRSAWVDPGTHVTSVGYNPNGRELDDATVAAALVVVESRDAALAPVPAGANDLTQPIRDGVITLDHIYAEIGELVEGTRHGRSSPDQLTLYKSVGVAVQDAAAAALVLARAREKRAGEQVVI
jgi:ornithine cyclodeaminase/alanine dehydrogenase-like protein (mu-crystallin family)